ncbi:MULTISPECIES: VOC family protein [unclassified Rhodococcus (in: high G+C Gram-positive bacteria)]|uniref:VOC family protein n=1 Tax=Rhodococcus sp. SJ-3 TaxID=3454628 RepID=UPI003F79D00F
MVNTHHTFDYIELAATDLGASRAFYEAAFGWKFNDYGPKYAGIRAAEGDGEVGGLTTLRAPGTAGPLVLLYSSDLDASVGAVEHAGGTISSGPYDFPGGRRFTFLDPSGNELGVWSEA